MTREPVAPRGYGCPLSENEAKVARLWRNHNATYIAEQLGVTRSAVHGYAKRVRAKGVPLEQKSWNSRRSPESYAQQRKPTRPEIVMQSVSGLWRGSRTVVYSRRVEDAEAHARGLGMSL